MLLTGLSMRLQVEPLQRATPISTPLVCTRRRLTYYKSSPRPRQPSKFANHAASRLSRGDGAGAGPSSPRTRIEKAVHDRTEIAKLAQEYLGKGWSDRAVALAIRQTQAGHDATGTWDQIIEHAMQQGKVNAAFRCFNDMKKRGQRPGAHTISHLFAGLTKNAASVNAAERAEALYASLKQEGTSVQPSVIHTNAALRVCREAGDVDAMFRIASDLPSHGPNRPDAITYDTILRGLRRHGEQAARERQAAEDPWQRPIALGRRVWEDVVNRWKAGSLDIDAQLVASMTGILAHGSEKDVDDILSLIEQTTGYQRLLPPVGHPDRPTHLAFSGNLLSVEPETESDFDGSAEDLIEFSEANHGGSNIPTTAGDTGSEFAPLESTDNIRYVEPNSFLLSIVLRTCVRFNAQAEAQTYWGLFTSKIVPDGQNYIDYLQLLSLGRLSSYAAELLKAMVSPRRQGGYEVPISQSIVTIAMKACLRDKRNRKSTRNALTVLSVATEKLYHACLPALQVFARLVLQDQLLTLEELELILGALRAQFLAVKSRAAYGRSSRSITAGPHDGGGHGTVHSRRASKTAIASQAAGAETVEIVLLTHRVTSILLSRPLSRDLPRGVFREARDSLFAQRAWLQSSQKSNEMTEWRESLAAEGQGLAPRSAIA